MRIQLVDVFAKLSLVHEASAAGQGILPAHMLLHDGITQGLMTGQLKGHSSPGVVDFTDNGWYSIGRLANRNGWTHAASLRGGKVRMSGEGVYRVWARNLGSYFGDGDG